MKRRISWRREEGSAAVEFALIFIVLLTILFGLISFGIALSRLEVYIGAAREGARFAAVRCWPDPSCTPEAIEARVRNAAGSWGDSITGTPVADPAGGCTENTVGDEVTVRWTQQITIDIPFVPGLNPLVINRPIEGVFRCE